MATNIIHTIGGAVFEATYQGESTQLLAKGTTYRFEVALRVKDSDGGGISVFIDEVLVKQYFFLEDFLTEWLGVTVLARKK